LIWDKHEVWSREELGKLQLARLQETVARAYGKVPFYKEAFDERGLVPEDIKSLADLSKLPFTTKDDLRRYYPYGMFAVPMREIVRVHSSSGTTGIPTVVGYTRRDLETWNDLVARIISQAGVTADDIVQISFGYGMFTGGFGLHYGMERVGATVIPISAGNTLRQIRTMRDFGTTALVSTPSYALHMAEVALENGIDPKRDLNVRVGLFGGEGSSDWLREEIEERWGMRATDNYGLSEVMGPGIAGECEAAAGMHISEDHIIAEVIDPKTGEQLPYGQEGELVLTAINKEALPVLRFRTKDLTTLSPEPCACGRTTVRMARVLGRTDDMMVIRGVNVFPSQIEAALAEIPEVAPFYQLIVETKNYLDQLTVEVEVPQHYFTGSFGELEALQQKIGGKLQTILGLSAKVLLVEPKTLPRTAGKAKRVVDNRNAGRV